MSDAPELHIASCVAYARPDAAERVARAIRSAGLAEVACRDERGRLVILIEAGSAARVLDVMDAVRALEGVLAVNLAYQHAEPESELQEPQP
jgi:nitrate reductase NapD